MLGHMEERIRHAITNVLSELGVPLCDFMVEHPADISHGDYATNVALVIAQALGKKPREVALQAIELLGGKIPHVEKIESAGPGFINFHLNRDFFKEKIAEALTAGETWGSNTAYAGKKVMVEYTDPNPFKELHIGHLVPNALGESLACLFEMSSAEVKRVTFQGDVGMHVAKGIMGLQQMNVAPANITPEILGKAYAHGATAFEENDDEKERIKALNKKIYERTDDEVNALYDEGKKVSIAYFEKAYAILGTKFDHYFFESTTGPIGKELVLANEGTIFEKSEGAIIYRGETRGLHTRVFVNAAGIPTYEAKDLGLVQVKHAWWPFDLSITVTGTEQKEYFKVVACAVGEVLPALAGRVELVPNGMLRLKEGKMSSRTGNVIPALSFIEDVVNGVLLVMSDRSVGNKVSVAHDIAVAAIKYAILRSTSGKDTMFDMKNSISFDGDSGPYLQYTHARAVSVLTKAFEADVTSDTTTAPDSPYTLERLVYQFPDVILRATREREPHYVASYLIEVASMFNAFYAAERIADTNDSYAPYKVALTTVVQRTLLNGLHALGMKAPETM